MITINRRTFLSKTAVAITSSVKAAVDTLPPVILFLLLAITVVTGVLGGFNSGISHGMNRGQTTTLALALALASILLMIVDFDRPRDGFIRVRQDGIRAVIEQMNVEHAPRSQPDAGSLE